MATQSYWDWKAAGERYSAALPIVEMVAVARRHGVGILGIIGNEDHLTADFPEDHTPFSRTYWPVDATGWVCACDLANVQGLGDAILRDARAGRTPWLKYMNFGGHNYGHEDGFQRAYANSDEHVHLSCRSDWITRSIGGYDPLSTGGTMSDTELTEAQWKGVWNTVMALQTGTTVLGYQDATAISWARGYGAYNAKDIELRTAARLTKAVADIKAGQQAPPPITDAQIEVIAQRVAAIIDGTMATQIAAQVDALIAARMKE